MPRLLTLLAGCSLATVSCTGPYTGRVEAGTGQCRSCFSGLPVALTLLPATNPEMRRLDKDLAFTDRDGLVWKAVAGDVTDGASIPDIFLPVTGPRFEPDFLPAAIVHDHYTNLDHRVRSWWSTARVFYDAMRVNHTPLTEAKLMYYAVYAFGPHWGRIANGTYCGPNCVNLTAREQVALRAQEPVGVRASPTDTYLFQPAFATPDDVQELLDIRARIVAGEANGQPLEPDDLAQAAERRHPQNLFLAMRAAALRPAP